MIRDIYIFIGNISWQVERPPQLAVLSGQWYYLLHG